MTVQNFQFAGRSLVPSVYLGPTMVGPKKLLVTDVLRWQGDAILNLVFANRRAKLLIF